MMKRIAIRHLSLLIFLCFVFSVAQATVKCGITQLMTDEYAHLLRGKKIGLITNHTAIDSDFQSTADILKKHSKEMGFQIVALFAPEHGLNGSNPANGEIGESKDSDGIPVFSLFGPTQRPTDEMLIGIDMLIYDIQDIGSRSYTYISTMFMAMEEAAKWSIPFVVLDRPNPINGCVVDGPLLEKQWRSLIGYVNVPYCHGMTVGELALFFNQEYHIGCLLRVIPMKGWKRSMTFADTGLPWIPTSPYIPDKDTPFYYPMTGILGELRFVNIGIGYTLPFKVVGAPWIDAVSFAKALNAQRFPGVHFTPFSFCPVYGRYAKKECHGVLIHVTDPLKFKPVGTQFLLLGMMKTLYPARFAQAVAAIKKQKDTLCKLYGNEEIPKIILEEKNIVWKLRGWQQKELEKFMRRREKYLIPAYGK